MAPVASRPAQVVRLRWFERQRARVRAAYPALRWRELPEHGAHLLTGSITIRSSVGVPHTFQISVLFPPSFPSDLPIAFDPTGQFPRDPNRHMYPDGRFCLWLPTERPVDFSTQSVVALLDHVATFLERQVIYDATGKWPGLAWPHGAQAFAQFMEERLGEGRMAKFAPMLTEQEHTAGSSPCPCGSGQTFRQCHQRAIRRLRERIPLETRRAALVGYLKER